MTRALCPALCPLVPRHVLERGQIVLEDHEDGERLKRAEVELCEERFELLFASWATPAAGEGRFERLVRATAGRWRRAGARIEHRLAEGTRRVPTPLRVAEALERLEELVESAQGVPLGLLAMLPLCAPAGVAVQTAALPVGLVLLLPLGLTAALVLRLLQFLVVCFAAGGVG